MCEMSLCVTWFHFWSINQCMDRNSLFYLQFYSIYEWVFFAKRDRLLLVCLFLVDFEFCRKVIHRWESLHLWPKTLFEQHQLILLLAEKENTNSTILCKSLRSAHIHEILKWKICTVDNGPINSVQWSKLWFIPSINGVCVYVVWWAVPCFLYEIMPSILFFNSFEYVLEITMELSNKRRILSENKHF